MSRREPIAGRAERYPDEDALSWDERVRFRVPVPLYLGKVIEIGPAERVIRSSRHPYTAALVSVSPSPDPPKEAGAPNRTILVGETPDAAHVPAGCRFHPRCPVAFDRCRSEEPPLFDVGGGQQAACWLAEGGRELPVLPASAAVPADGARSPAPPHGSGSGELQTLAVIGDGIPRPSATRVP